MSESIAQERAAPFEFTGNGWEYFKIWIVNVVLTILTLGIYSAWAKVRNKRYFYGNTRLEGSTFDYLASPISILKGRLIAVAVVAVFIVAVSIQPLAEPVFWLLFLIALPWLVVRAMTFNARNSAYRNIRFNFDSNYGEAAKVFIGWLLLTLVTLGLAAPHMIYKQKQFMISNSEFGQTPFSFSARSGQFYSIYLKAIGILVLMVIAFSVISGVIGAGMAQAMSPTGAEPVPGEPTPAMMMAIFLPMLFLLPVYMWLGAYIQASVANVVFNHSQPGEHRLVSTLRTGPLFWIYLSNMLAIVVSLGLLIPWAKVRLARYRLENLSMAVDGNLDDFLAAEQSRTSATGEELADVFDVDLGL